MEQAELLLQGLLSTLEPHTMLMMLIGVVGGIILGAIPGMSKIATGMMKKKIEKANIPSLEELQEMAQIEGVELIACKMTVDMMEIDEDKLIDGVPVWTAEDFLKYSTDCKICLFT